MITGIDEAKRFVEQGQKLRIAFLYLGMIGTSVLILSLFVPVTMIQLIIASVISLSSLVAGAMLMSQEQDMRQAIFFAEREREIRGLNHVADSAIRCVEEHNKQFERKSR